jgi:hypothetical protein
MKTILRLILLPCLALTAFASVRDQDGPEFTIINAEYGTDDQRVDVLDLFRPLVSHGCLLLRAQWDLGDPDPAPGVVKDVKIDYRINGVRKSAVFRQDQDIILPPPTVALTIVSATFGVDVRRVDVTDAVRAAVVDASLHLEADWRLGRVDPAFGTVKTVEITYLQDGVPKTATFKETDEVNLP